MLKYIEKLGEAYPYDYEEPKICKVELWDFSRANENDEARKEAVCLIASLSYGNDFCKNPDKLWDLLIEKGHESPFEFIKAFGCINRVCKAWNLREINCPFDDEEGEVGAFSVYSVLRRIIATFKLKVPIFVARQIMRHRSFSYLEMSRRYVKGDKVGLEFWKPPKYIAIKSELPNGKEVFYSTYGLAEVEYNIAVNSGIKPEQARAFLPLGLYTQFWMQGDYKAWLNFFIHRLHPEAQEETRLVAKAMWGLLKENQPEIVKTMANYIGEWTKECNSIFTPAREKKAEWFRENFLKD